MTTSATGMKWEDPRSAAWPDFRSMVLEKEEPIPVYILTGFLGSGKTTFLRRLLASPAFADTAVIINEFGSTSVDHLLLDHSQDLVEPVAGGCLCCLPRSRLVSSMFDFLQASYTNPSRQFSKLIIETSGLSDPLPLIQAFGSDPVRLSRFELAKVITVVDATELTEDSLRNPIHLSQISSSDMIVVTKMDLAGSFLEARDILRKLSTSEILMSTDAGASEVLKSKPRSTRFGSDSIGESRSHLNDYSDVSLPIESPIAEYRLFSFLVTLRAALGADLLRLKGLVPLSEHDDQVEVHLSGSSFMSLQPKSGCPSSPGEIVAIVQSSRRPDILRIFETLNSD